MNKVKIEVNSPSNIALIKYWGKKPTSQHPLNPSLSFCLNSCVTNTVLIAEKLDSVFLKRNIDRFVIFNFEDQNISKDNEIFHRFLKFYGKFIERYPILTSYRINIISRNTFPKKAGIASSASSYSSFSHAILTLIEILNAKKLDSFVIDKTFLDEVSTWSRIGSGSASRSIYDGYNYWGKSQKDNNFLYDSKQLVMSNDYSTQLKISQKSLFNNIRDAILIIDSSEKEFSSSQGHLLMNDNVFKNQRLKNVDDRLSKILKAMELENWEEFSSIVESEALELHALMLTSTPWFILLKPNSLKIIELIKKYRKENNIKMTFTIDAGPNLHLLYPESEKEKVQSFINNHCLEYLENKSWIDDKIGSGSKILNVEYTNV
jgi:diphosphomevalonate decarboxylase